MKNKIIWFLDEILGYALFFALIPLFIMAIWSIDFFWDKLFITDFGLLVFTLIILWGNANGEKEEL